ncbi:MULTISPECIES: DUF4358 domain-containing protein [Clostridium]|nr:MULTISPECIES: DUF4358 domain-containing protein [Clostridium]MDU2283808.1 DUF4358 domain-containing protein [Clostridium sp.]MDU4787970.1 DUF4358 domain-containing protein [Clostridium sp.]
MRKLSFLMIILAIFTMSGCAKSYKNITTDEISNNILQKDENLQKSDKKMLKRLYGLNSDDYEEFSLCISKSTMEVNELLIIKVKDKNQIEAIECAMEQRVSNQLNNFGGYAPKQAKIIEDYELIARDKFVFLCIGENAENNKQIFIESIKV